MSGILATIRDSITPRIEFHGRYQRERFIVVVIRGTNERNSK